MFIAYIGFCIGFVMTEGMDYTWLGLNIGFVIVILMIHLILYFFIKSVPKVRYSSPIYFTAITIITCSGIILLDPAIYNEIFGYESISTDAVSLLLILV